jgi:translocation and assembly module TamB
MSTEETRAAPPEPPPPPRRRHRWPELLALALVLLGGVALLWLVASESGLRVAAQLAERAAGGRLALGEPRGRLLGEVRLATLVYADDTRRAALSDVAMRWSPAALLDGRLQVDALTAGSVDIALRDSGEPLRLPDTLALPLDLVVERLAIARLQLGRLADDGSIAAGVRLQALAARIESGAGRHRIGALRFDGPAGEVSGDGSIGAAAPFPLQARARLEGTHQGRSYRIEAQAAGELARFPVMVRASGMDLAGSGEIEATPFAAVPFARAQLRVSGIDPQAVAAGAPRAALTLEADLRPAQEGSGGTAPAPQDWVLAGPVSLANDIAGPLDRGLLPLDSAAAQARWEAGRLVLERLQLRHGRARAQGEASWQDDRAEVALDLREVSLAALDGRLQPTAIAGRLSARLAADEQALVAELAEPRFTARFDALHRAQVLELRRARVEARGGGLDASGRLALAGERAFTLRGSLQRFDPSLFARLPPAALNAEFDAKGMLAGSPRGELTLRLRPSRFDGKPLAGEGRLSLQPRRLAQADVALDLAGNAIVVAGAFGAPGDRLRLALDAPRLAALGHGLAGRAKAQLALSGSVERPAADFDLAAEELQLPNGWRLARLAAKGALREGADAPFDTSVVLAGFRLAPDEDAFGIESAQLEARGTRAGHVLQASGQLRPAVRVTLAAAGALAEGPQWSGEVRGFELTGEVPLRLAAPVRLAAGPALVELGAAEFASGAARVRLAETRWTPQALVTGGELSGLALGIGFDAGERPILTREGLRLGAQWQLRLAERADGTLNVFREGGDLTLGGDAPVSLGLTTLELRANALDGQVGWSLEAAGRQLGEASGAGSLRVERGPQGWRLAPEAPIAGAVRAHMPSIAWLGPWLDPNLRLDGALDAYFGITGTGADPRGSGDIRGERLSVALVEQGMRLVDGTLAIAFDQQRVRLDALSFASEPRVRPREGRIDYQALAATPGRLRAGGSMELTSGRGELQVEAERLAVLQRPDQWLMLSGSGRYEIGPASSGFRAQLRADAGYIELQRLPPPRLSDDVVIKGRERGGGTRRLPLTLDVLASLGESFYFRGRGLDSRLAGEVRIRGDGRGPLRASGQISTRRGSFDAYGQALAIERGIVNFLGPLDDAGLNVLAVRKNLPVKAGVAVTGTMRNPQVRLVSEPNVPDAEKLSWIVLGRGLEQGSGADTGLLLSAASAILGGREGGGISRQLASSLGLDEISVTTGDFTASGSRLPTTTVAGSRVQSTDPALATQIVTVGKRLSSRAYLSYEQSLAGAESVVRITYQLSRGLSLIGRAGSDNSLDLFYTFSFK